MKYQVSLGAQSCPSLCDPMNRSTPGLPVEAPKSQPRTSCPSLLPLESIPAANHFHPIEPLFTSLHPYRKPSLLSAPSKHFIPHRPLPLHRSSLLQARDGWMRSASYKGAEADS